jgi:protein O-GlcNAc transferase
MGIDIDKAIEWNDKGCDLAEAGKLKEAIECFLTALKSFPAYAEAYSNMASCYDDLGQADKAIETYKKAIECPTDDHRKAECWRNLAIAYERKGDKKKAEECHAAARKLRMA